jgi:hypothetical protein
MILTVITPMASTCLQERHKHIIYLLHFLMGI